MTALFWQSIGRGCHDLILLHGWGLNSDVWSCITKRLTPYFRLHLVDLPGYGRSSKGYGALTLEQITNEVVSRAPAAALWLGWSLGGLIAIEAVRQQSHAIRGLITVASSPHFCSEPAWPGISPALLCSITNQLSKNFTSTINRFCRLQTFGSKSAYQDTHWLKNIILAHPQPTIEILTTGLFLLKTIDLRFVLPKLYVPMLHLYGSLDLIVPRTVAPLIDNLCSHSKSIIISGAAHVPFISHPEIFCQLLYDFNSQIDR